MPTVLIVDDDERICVSLSEVLARQGLEVGVAVSAESALSRLARIEPDIVLTDVRLPGLSGLQLLSTLKERKPGVDVILMSAFEDLPTVASAMRDGAVDFLVKPLDLHKVRDVMGRVLEDRSRRNLARAGVPVEAVPEVVGSEPAEPRVVGRNPMMIEVFKKVGQAAANRAPVLIRGESGTGKELVARSIHTASSEASRPFVAVNCAAMPEPLLESELFGHIRGAYTGAVSDRAGRFATAEGGTIFLDEIGDTSGGFQSRLLRVVQEREYYPLGSDRPQHTDARVIAATHRDLEERIGDGRFRQDLYYRLRVIEIVLPPLRERKGDIVLLADHLVRRAGAVLGRQPPVITDEAMAVLVAHPWPGNVRELENCLSRAVVAATADVIRPEHLGLDRETTAGPPGTLDRAERDHVARVLELTGGQKVRAAEILGVSRPRLDRLIRKHSLENLAPGRGQQAD